MSRKDWWSPGNVVGRIWKRVLMSNVIPWPSIELLHNVVRTLNHLASLTPTEGGRPLGKVLYRAKVKLHGTNCAVQVLRGPGGSLCDTVTQSRTTILTPQDDLHGFSKWVNARGLGNSAGDHWSYFSTLQPGITVFGEWAGPGVEGGMAISGLPEKQFCVFGILADGRLVYEPGDIVAYLNGSAGYTPKNMHVLPWMPFEVEVDFASQDSLKAAAEKLNALVSSVEKEDPWIKETFGVSGMGEGVVLYPVFVDGLEPPTDPETLAHYMFKAKGEKHRTAGTKEAVQVAPEVVATVDAFVDLMVTPARLEQGLSVVCGGQRDPKLTGKFLLWVGQDVQKESVAELEASGLTWDQVVKVVQVRAREWFLPRR